MKNETCSSNYLADCSSKKKKVKLTEYKRTIAQFQQCKTFYAPNLPIRLIIDIYD